MSKPEHVVVVGGGIIGASCAWYLSKKGVRVTIIDKGTFAGACSHANCGLISPSHVLPLAEPGVAFKLLRAVFAKNSPLKIRWRADWDLWRFLFNFGMRCNFQDMVESAAGIDAILRSSRTLYQELIMDEKLNCEFQTRGCLFVYKTKKEFDHFGESNRILEELFQAGHKRISGEELVVMEPALKPGLAGAWFYEDDAHVRPNVLMAELKRVLLQRGVAIRENVEFTDFTHHGNRITAVNTEQGTIECDTAVLATGAFTPLIQGQIGCDIPIQPGKGYSMTMKHPSNCPKIPMIFPEHKVAVTPMDSGYRLGSSMEFAGYDTELRPERLQLLRDGATHYLHEPYAEPVEEQWYGWRPMTWDSKPIIDRAPAHENVWVAAGHNMIGLSTGPATGKLVSEMILGETPHINPRHYRIDRFD